MLLWLWLALGLHCFLATAFASSISIEMGKDNESPSIIPAPPASYPFPLPSSENRGIFSKVLAAQNLLLEGSLQGDALDFVENLCRYHGSGYLFPIISSAGFEELAFYCAQKFQTFSWFYILDRVGNDVFAGRIIELLKKYELLLITFGPRFQTDPDETSICREAVRAENVPVCEFIRLQVGEQGFARLLKAE
jgi:hypothetical protein